MDEKLLEKANYSNADEIIEEQSSNSAIRGYDEKLKAIM